VDIDHYLKEEDIPKLKRGIKWEGDRLALEKVVPRNARAGNESWTQLEVTLHHGKKREIRRLFYALGYDVKKLRRVQIGQFKLRGLPRAHIRTLRKQEIRLLFEAGD
jgi:23S rRNA pseudouridine2605 synthase